MVADLSALTGFTPATCKRIIIKVGSALLVAPDGSVRRDWLASLVAELAARRAAAMALVGQHRHEKPRLRRAEVRGSPDWS